MLEVVRQHVERLETSVPNFVCHEQITSRRYERGKVKEETRATSILTTTRSTKNGHGSFEESRADLVINGRPSKRNEISDPFVWRGGPAYSDLHYLFNSDHGIECRTYKLTGVVKLNSKNAYLVETHAAAGQRDACPDLPDDSADKIWLDSQSLNVIRIESFDPPTKTQAGDTGGLLTLDVDYMPVVFDGAEYWLPSHFISRVDFESSRHFQYEASFTDYHKYGAESVVHVDPNQ